jgi:hypothetical protein
MGAGFYPALCEYLKDEKSYKKRQGKGSHEIWISGVNGARLVVPRTIMSRDTANDILKLAGIGKKF